MKALITLMILAIIGLLLYDFFFKESVKPLILVSPAARPADFHGRLQLANLKYDVQSHRIKTDLHLELSANDDRTIKSVSFSPMESRKKHRPWLLSVVPGDCKFSTFDEAAADGKGISSAAFECADMTLGENLPASEIWYPFDSYEVELFPRACANNNGACIAPDNTSIDSFEVIMADQNFVGLLTAKDSPRGAFTLRLSRKFFVRLVSIIFLVLSLIFLLYLGVAGDPKDLLPKSLGFFATLWGLRSLIVPSSITVFPTIVDYCILSIFCLLFLVVLRKLYVQEVPAPAQEDSGQGVKK